MVDSAKDGALAGSADLIAKLQALGALDNGKIALGAVRAGMNVAKSYAENRIYIGKKPHRLYTGELVAPGYGLKNLRVVTTNKTDNGLTAALLSVRKKAFYQVQFIERGTSKMEAHPWLRRSFFASQDGQKAAVIDYLRKRVLKLAKDGKP